MDTKIEQYFECLCRTCMHEVFENAVANEEQRQWQYIFDRARECGDNQSIAELLSNIMPQIEVTLADYLPKKICNECVQQLTRLHRFQQMCIQSDREMREIIAKNFANLNETVSDISAADQELHFELIEHRNERKSVDSLPKEQQQTTISDPLQNVSEANEAGSVSQEDVNNLVKNEPCDNNDEYVPTDNHQEALHSTIDLKEEVVTVVARDSSAQKLKFCDVCGKTFNKGYNLRRHKMKLHSTENATRVCEPERPGLISGQELSLPEHSPKRSGSISELTTTHAGSREEEKNDMPPPTLESNIEHYRFQCDTCNSSFHKLDSLYEHRLVHHGTAEQKLKFCDVCGKTFNKGYNLRRHKMKLHSTENVTRVCEPERPGLISGQGLTLSEHSPNPSGSISEFTTTHAGSREEKKNDMPPPTVESNIEHFRFQCDTCNSSFNKLDSLYEHRLVHHGTAEQKLKFCDVCGKTFNKGYNLRRHKMKLHSTENATRVSEPERPGLISGQGLSLPEHSQAKPGEGKTKTSTPEHSTEARWKKQRKNYLCEICKKTIIYRSATTIQNHIRTHTGERPFLCPECGKSFTTQGNMREHRLRHGNEKSYECPYCPARFYCNADIFKHKITHKTIKKHICDICGQSFNYKGTLTKHKRYKHSGQRPYKCDYCEMCFGRADHKRRHMLTHTGERPFKCKYCDRAFAQQSDQVKHLRTHLGENVYGCTLCPSAFRSASERRIHFTIHKNEDEETREQNMKALKDKEAELQLKFFKDETNQQFVEDSNQQVQANITVSK